MVLWEAYEAGCEAHCLILLLGGEEWYYYYRAERVFGVCSDVTLVN
jgi:hypothetical protein